MTRKDDTGADRFQYDSGEEEFIYNDDHESTARGRDDNVYDRRQVRSEGRQYRERSEPQRYDEVRGYNRSSDRMNADGYDSVDDEKFFSQDPRIQSDIPEKRNSYYQKGNASWYGREFHGRLTASGERFDMKEFTAAHRSLPFGTVVLVENLDNGRKVKVKINDRGPFKKDRILDVSHAAAGELDMLKTGEAMVGRTVITLQNTWMMPVAHTSYRLAHSIHR
ncbi:MAG: septal ring lytic transglycosylase RlpA family protein [Spirochaetota bacterium]